MAERCSHVTGSVTARKRLGRGRRESGARTPTRQGGRCRSEARRPPLSPRGSRLHCGVSKVWCRGQRSRQARCVNCISIAFLRTLMGKLRPGQGPGVRSQHLVGTNAVRRLRRGPAWVLAAFSHLLSAPRRQVDGWRPDALWSPVRDSAGRPSRSRSCSQDPRPSSSMAGRSSGLSVAVN